MKVNISSQKLIFNLFRWSAIVLVLWAVFSNFAFSQSPVPPPVPTASPPNETDCFIHFREKMPILKSCESKDNYNESRECTNEKVVEFIYSNLKIPPLARQKNIEGMVVISFTIEDDGKTSNHRITRDIGGGCGKEALRVVKLLPEWLPGEQRGKKVKVMYNMPVKFKLN